MRAKINPETGKVEWIGMGSGENWVDYDPDTLPEQTDSSTSLHYDEQDGYYYD